MLKLEPSEIEIVRKILLVHLPGIEVWAFGSRVHGDNLKPFSDIDLVVITETPLDVLRMAELKAAFSASALPFKVDLLDWSTTNVRFRNQILKHYLVIQPADQASCLGS